MQNALTGLKSKDSDLPGESQQDIDYAREAEHLSSSLKIELFSEDVYKPRSFSYLLAAWAIRRAQCLKPGATVLDAGTGSGVVAIAIKTAVKNIEVLASDISVTALVVTQDNARANGVEIPVVKMDLVQKDQCGDLDMITMHPPAVPYAHDRGWGFSAGMSLATDGGVDGAAKAVGIVRAAAKCLNKNGEILLLLPHWCARRRVMEELDATFSRVEVLDTQPATFFPLHEGRPTRATLANLSALVGRGEAEVDLTNESAASSVSVVWGACPREGVK
jgi:methylase of polypeptide subunit release factors